MKLKVKTLTRAKVSLCLAALLSCYTPTSLANENRTKQDLTEVQQELQKSQQNYKKQKSSLNTLQKGVKEADKKIAQSAKELRNIDSKIDDNQAQNKALEAELVELDKEKQRLGALLAAQLKSAYMVGGSDYAQLLLNQQDTAKLERTISYYDYFNKARLEQLDALKVTLAKIEENQRALAQNRAALEALKAEQQSQHQALLAAKQTQKKRVDEIQGKLKKLNTTIAYLQDNEQTLIDTLKELENKRDRQIAMVGLGQSKGKLNWPTKGKITHSFGSRKHQGFNWKGVVISASEGSDIKSVHDGQVVYADWLKGFGWVIVVDHGQGYMSLYGHAQSLLKTVGDQVYQGETIALVGQSGGQNDPGLYFEIRHKGRAVNPTSWCRAG